MDVASYPNLTLAYFEFSGQVGPDRPAGAACYRARAVGCWSEAKSFLSTIQWKFRTFWDRTEKKEKSSEKTSCVDQQTWRFLLDRNDDPYSSSSSSSGGGKFFKAVLNIYGVKFDNVYLE